ncbi:hypothetical protein GS399_03325 [Pedobacter sp. HMF7647]|uniref:YdhG-like domain-containing protein n=1 Tax=Hufsiella arboris TaxID=2695275 RepID=A0A7K1Y788_9SPHI|nr:DUF1801 domain-containing protein [Hufsiella arboris]MXV49989.1 hypothetical protein [Hufsiella arboris]
MNSAKPTTMQEYFAEFPAEVQQLLERIRASIKAAVPEATETIGYGIPTFKLNGKNLVHFGAFKNHIGFYPTPDGIKEFEQELSQYQNAKGSVQFPLSEPFPMDLILRMTEFRKKKLLEKVK